jgi:hypothetical protein
MNVENDFLTDFDLFGKQPEIYYHGKSKKSSAFGIVLTAIYIVIYIAFLIYKIVRMLKRIDLTFYDSYTFQGLPSINLTNNEFYGGFGMGGIVDEKMYRIEVFYVSKVKVNGVWQETTKQLPIEVCKLEWFGSEYQEIFADQPMNQYYCIKSVDGMVLEGYSNLERFSYFNVKYYPCVGQTKDGEECYDYYTKLQFFSVNTIELKIQDNDLNPENYKKPVIRRVKDMNSPVFHQLYQLIYSYIQIVNIETDEDITGLNFFTNTIRREQYTKYDESFLIASPLFYGDILQTGGPICDVYLQLSAKVLTEKRQYVTLIAVLGDVGGLMEILLTFLNIISSFITEVLYDRSLINNLFSFDLNKKLVILNVKKKKRKSNDEDNQRIDIKRFDSIKLRENLQNIENNNKNIEIVPKEKLDNQFQSDSPFDKKNISSTRKKIKKKTKKKIIVRSASHNLKSYNDIEKTPNYENKLSIEENKIIDNKDTKVNGTMCRVNTSGVDRDLKKVYINNWTIFCFWCTSKKRNVNKVLFEEGSKIITKRLDIMNMFNHLYINEIIQEKLGFEARDMEMSDEFKNYLHFFNSNNIDS